MITSIFRILLCGDAPASSAGSAESTATMLAAFEAGLPGLMKSANAQIGPNEWAQLQSSMATSPEYAKLQADIYGTSGKEMNRLGNEFADANAMASARRDASVMAGPGMELIRSANRAQREIDPEYYKLREQSAAGIGELFKGQTAGEEEAITRFLNRQNIQSGNFGVGGMSNVISNAQTFGNASRDRLGQAIGMATGAMPGMRSGIDVFQQATGKPSFANTGDNKFMGATQGAGNQAAGYGQNLLNQAGDNNRTAMGINANRRDGLDRFNETIGSVCCFIFMEGLNGQLPWTVRKYRDMYYHAEPEIALGYRRMAKWLVPLMERFDFVKSLVNETMIMPMVQYGFYLEGLSDNGSQYKGRNNFWLKAWKFLGK